MRKRKLWFRPELRANRHFAPLLLLVLLGWFAEAQNDPGREDRRYDVIGQPCEVDRSRTISDATVTNPYECKSRDSSPALLGHGLTAAGTHVSLTTLAAPKRAQKAYNKAAKELGKRNRNYGKAAHHLETAVRLYPEFAVAWHLLGETWLATEQNDRAQAAFERAVAADPRLPNSYLPLALMELKRGRLAEAARFADEVLKHHPHLSEARFYSAVAHYNQGHISDARESISLITRNGDDKLYPRVRVMLGEMLAAEGNFHAAAAEYRRFLELEPHSRVSDLIRRQLEDWRRQRLLD